MTECLVCSMPNTGFHFGVNSCRACAAFFRRTNQLKLEYKCRFGQKCDVTKKNRYSCRYCRFQKCIRIGMAKEASNNTHSPSTSESPRSDNATPILRTSESSEILSDDHTNNQQLLKSKLHELFLQDRRITTYTFPSIPLTLCQQALIAYSEHNKHWLNCTHDKLKFLEKVDMDQFTRHHYKEVEYIAEFCMAIQPFAQLPYEQKWIVFKHFWPRFIEMDRTFTTVKLLGSDPTDQRVVTHNGMVVDFSRGILKLEEVCNYREEELRSLMKGSIEVFKKLFIIPFKKYKPDEFELMYMCMSMMWNIKDLDGISSSTLEIADDVRNRLSEDLYNYYAFELKLPNYAHRIYKLSHLVTAIDRVSERRQEDSYMSRTFNIFKHDIFLDELKNI